MRTLVTDSSRSGGPEALSGSEAGGPGCPNQARRPRPGGAHDCTRALDWLRPDSGRRCAALGAGLFATLTSLGLVLAQAVAHGAGPPLQFAKMVGASGGLAIASDSQGNIYAGTAYETALVKHDSQGNRLWSFGVPGGASGSMSVRGIVIDSMDDVYVCGELWGRVKAGAIDYDRTAGATFFAKFTADGSNVLATIFLNLRTMTKPFAATRDGRFLVAGSFSDPVTYQGITVVPTATWPDVLLFEINADGSPVWYRRGTGNLDDYADGVVSTHAATVVLAGTCQSSSFGMGGVTVSNSAEKSLYLLGLDAGGSGLWAKSAGSSRDAGNGLTISSAIAYSASAQAIIWSGDFTGSLNLTAPAIASTGGKDVFIAKLASGGGVMWVRTLGGPQDQFANAAAIDPFGNVYVAGFYSGHMTIGSQTLTSIGERDIFVAKLRDDGTIVWAKGFGWTANDDEVSLSFTRLGELLVTGTVRGGASIDGTFLEGINVSDGFIAKFHSEGVPPRFVADPESRVVSAGMTLALTAELAVNDPSVRFQWWFNGAPLAGQTNKTLTITNAQFTNAGSYYLVAANDAGAVTTAPALVSYTDASTLLLSVHPSLTIFGTPGRTYRIDYSTEARATAQWTVATNLTLVSSPEVWIDPTAAVGEKRFYRVLLVP